MTSPAQKRARPHSLEIYPGQRSKEKRLLFGRFVLKVVADLYKQRFYEHFNNKCFKCGIEKAQPEIGRPSNLCMDHHVPMALGGHLVPGNLVALCRKCNEKKRDTPPDVFYTNDELTRLQPLLDSQTEIFAFEFDYERWQEDRSAYLLELGIDATTVHAVLHDEWHPSYVGPAEQQDATTITLTISDELMQLFKRT